MATVGQPAPYVAAAAVAVNDAFIIRGLPRRVVAAGRRKLKKDIVYNVADGGWGAYIVLTLNYSVVALPQNHVRYSQ
ncbi:hypothetical protein D3C85_1548810 [compost metagenome]